jgi:hypothetical protein
MKTLPEMSILISGKRVFELTMNHGSSEPVDDYGSGICSDGPRTGGDE